MVGTEPWPRPRSGLWAPPGMCDSTISPLRLPLSHMPAWLSTRESCEPLRILLPCTACYCRPGTALFHITTLFSFTTTLSLSPTLQMRTARFREVH